MARLAKFDPLREKANEIAEKVADLHLNGGIDDPSEAVAMQKEAILSDNFLDRVVESTNLLLFKHAFATQSDKRAEFPTADSNRVKEILASDAPKNEKVASVWDRDLAGGEVYKKFASEKIAHDEYGNQLDECGFPIADTLPELSNEIMVKRAAVEAYEQTQRAAETLREMNFEKLAAVRQVFHSLKGYIKAASDSGQELGSIAIGLVNEMDSVEKRANCSYLIDEAVNELVGERKIKVAAYQDYLEKVADLDVTESGHTIHRGADQIVVQLHTCLGYMDEGVNGTGYGVAPKGDHHGFLTVDENIPYEIKGIKHLDQSRPALVKGRYFS